MASCYSSALSFSVFHSSDAPAIMTDFCKDCTCGRAQANAGNETVEDAARASARPERSFTAPLDWVEPTEGIEPAVPLRSKMWWNNPEDGGFHNRSALTDRHVWGVRGEVPQQRSDK